MNSNISVASDWLFSSVKNRPGSLLCVASGVSASYADLLDYVFESELVLRLRYQRSQCENRYLNSRPNSETIDLAYSFNWLGHSLFGQLLGQIGALFPRTRVSSLPWVAQINNEKK